MNHPELVALLEAHEKRGLPWVSIKTEDFRELLALVSAPAPASTEYQFTALDGAAISACIRQWPFPHPDGA